MTNWPRNTSSSNENSMNALPEEELRRRQAHAPELLRVPDDFEVQLLQSGRSLFRHLE
jgi:phosphoserine aminotransferase